MITRVVLSTTIKLPSSIVQLNSRCLSLCPNLKSSDSPEKPSFISKLPLYGPEKSVASKNFTNRWAMFVPAFATHICLGAPYGQWFLIWFISRHWFIYCSKIYGIFGIFRLVGCVSKFIKGIWFCGIFLCWLGSWSLHLSNEHNGKYYFKVLWYNVICKVFGND